MCPQHPEQCLTLLSDHNTVFASIPLAAPHWPQWAVSKSPTVSYGFKHHLRDESSKCLCLTHICPLNFISNSQYCISTWMLIKYLKLKHTNPSSYRLMTTLSFQLFRPTVLDCSLSTDKALSILIPSHCAGLIYHHTHTWLHNIHTACLTQTVSFA